MRLTVLSNGHGEDAIGARLLKELRRQEGSLSLSAFPLVGLGKSYAEAGFSLHGHRRALPGGGLTFHSLTLLEADLRAGIISHTIRQLRDLSSLRTDFLVTVGDVWAQLLSRLVKVRRHNRVSVQTLVSSHLSAGRVTAPNRIFMERITLFERVLLRGSRRVFVRDEATASWLRANAVAQATFPGSLLLDGPRERVATGTPIVVLLPGSRDWAHRPLGVMLEAARLAPGFRYSLPWTGSELSLPPGWRVTGGVISGSGVSVELTSGPLEPLLRKASAAVGTSGTGNEEAAAMGLPVITFEVAGLHTASFMANQQRLLGESLLPVAGTPAAIAAQLQGVIEDEPLRERIAKAALERFGAPGGIGRMASEILRLAGRL